MALETRDMLIDWLVIGLAYAIPFALWWSEQIARRWWENRKGK